MAGHNSGFAMFQLLLWKNYILQKRQLMEIVDAFVPLIFAILLLLIRIQYEVEMVDSPTHYPEFNPGNPSGTHVFSGKFILYAPNNTEVEEIMNIMQSRFNGSEDVNSSLSQYEFRAFPDEESLLKDYIENKDYSVRRVVKGIDESPVLAAVIFKSAPGSDEISYRIRFPGTHQGFVQRPRPKWLTERRYPELRLPVPREQVRKTDNGLRKQFLEYGGIPGYWQQGFLFLQSAIDTAIIQNKAKDSSQLSDFNVSLNRYPFPKYRNDKFLLQLHLFFPLCILMSYNDSVANIAKNIAIEKETRLRESMRMMGLPNWVHWCAWYTKSFLLLLIPTILMAVIFKVEVGTQNSSILYYTHGSIVVVFLLTYLFSAIMFAFLISSLCSRAMPAAMSANVIFCAGYLPYVFLQPYYHELSMGAKIALSFISNTAMAFGCRIITILEGTGREFEWSQITEGSSPDDNLSLLIIMLMMVVDGLLYLTLAVYIEGVFPGHYGVPLPWNFPFKKWYWCGGIHGKADDSVKIYPEDSSNIDEKANCFQEEPEEKAGIRIVGLRKVFRNKTVGLNGLNLNFYENQVTALLGHNGAGKTVAMSLVTGLYSPTSGTAIVNGFDIRTDMQSVRQSMGVCPQHDVLFDDMTVQEHLEFVCWLKGYDNDLAPAEIDRMITALKLDDKKHSQVNTLSGGTKRKLSVAIAFVGGSKIVILDEPTAGMDPRARRCVWNLLSMEKKGRTIVLSTHYMDEADLLGDRIAIMAKGQAVCSGTSLYLKTKFGGGYNLTMVKELNCQVNLITQLLQKHIPEAIVLQDTGNEHELSYRLPEGETVRFSAVFEELEQRMDELGISSYGCSITQLEEVFIRVNQQVEKGEKPETDDQIDEESLSGHTIRSAMIKSEDEVNEKVSTQSQLLNNQEINPLITSSHEIILEINDDKGQMESQIGVASKTQSYHCQNDHHHHHHDHHHPKRRSGFLLQQLKAMLAKKIFHAKRNIFLLIIQFCVPIFYLCVTLASVKFLYHVDKDGVELKLDLRGYAQRGKPVTTMECPASADICSAYKDVAELESTVVNTEDKMFEEYILDKSEYSLFQVNSKYIVGLRTQGDPEGGTKKMLTGYFNNQPYHAAPVALNLVHNSILRNLSGNNNLKLTVSNYPLPMTDDDKIETGGETEGQAFKLGFGVAFAVSFLAASHILFIIEEREIKSKQLQFLSGAKFLIFWLGHFLFDMGNYVLCCLGMMIFLIAFQLQCFNATSLSLFFLMLFMYGWAVIPAMYLFSFLFDVPGSGFGKMMTLNMITGMASVLVILMLTAAGLALTEVAQISEWPLLLMPNFNLGFGIQQIVINHKLHVHCPRTVTEEVCEFDADYECCKYYPIRYFDFRSPGIGKYVFSLFMIGFVCLALVLFIESKVIQRLSYVRCRSLHMDTSNAGDGDDDDDVAVENERVRKGNLQEMFKTDSTILKDLTKYYGKVRAVDRVCLGVHRGECFGLLGVNGAGKTTVMMMLTGELPVTWGDAYITGNSVKNQLTEVQKTTSYCPQFDALIPELTGRETLTIFARLRGVNESEIDSFIDKLANDLLFTEHIDKPCGTYSGGNSRKLSTALTIISDPPVLILDEPTRGLDPVARRHLWNTLSKSMDNGTSIILTSQSMEECDALCTRLGIMVKGKFHCLGSPQHLKSKFGEGYSLMAETKTMPSVEGQTSESLDKNDDSFEGKPDYEQWELDLEPLKSFIESSFPDCQLKDIHPGYVHYHIANRSGVTWAALFKKMEEAKATFHLEAYSVGQTSLEEVFLGFANKQ